MSKRARPRPSPLLAALRAERWTYREGAAFIGMSPRRLAAYARGEREPHRRLTPNQEQGILALTNRTPEELWPSYGRQNGLLANPEPKRSKLCPELLSAQGVLQLPEDPDELLERREVERCFLESLTHLKPQEAKVALRVLRDEEEHARIGLELGISRVWITFLAARATRKLRKAPRLAEFRQPRAPRRRR